MDRLSGRDTRSQWKNWEKGKDKELKRERERERGLSSRSQHSGRPVEEGEGFPAQTEQAAGVQRDRAGQSFNAATQEAKG